MNDGDNKEYKLDILEKLYYSFLFFLLDKNTNVLKVGNDFLKDFNEKNKGSQIKMENAIDEKISADFNINKTAKISFSKDKKAIVINHKKTNEKQGIYDEVLIYLNILDEVMVRKELRNTLEVRNRYKFNKAVGKKDLKNNSNLNKNNIENDINNNKKEEQVVKNPEGKQRDLLKLYSAMIDNQKALNAGNGGHEPYELTCESASEICNYEISKFTFADEGLEEKQTSKTIKIPAGKDIKYFISSNKKRIYINDSNAKECLGVIDVEMAKPHAFLICTTGIAIDVLIDDDRMKDQMGDIKKPNDDEDNIQYFLHHEDLDDKNLIIENYGNNKLNKNINKNKQENIKNNKNSFIENLLHNDFHQELDISNHKQNLNKSMNYVYNKNTHNSLLDNLDKNENDFGDFGEKSEDFDLSSSKSNNDKNVNKQENKNNNNNNPEMINENINDDEQVSINSQNRLENMNESDNLSGQNNDNQFNQNENKFNNNEIDLNNNIPNLQNRLENMNENDNNFFRQNNNNQFNQNKNNDSKNNIFNNNEIIYNQNQDPRQNGFIDKNMNFNQKINNNDIQNQFPENIDNKLTYEQQIKLSNNSDQCWNNLKWLDCCGLCRDK